jgi:hypothetical protein
MIIVGFVVNRSSILFEHQLSARYRLTIREKSQSSTAVVLGITYHNPPAIGMYVDAEQTIARPSEPLSFSAITDASSGIICVFDKNGVGFLLIYDPIADDLCRRKQKDMHSNWDGLSGIQSRMQRLSVLELRPMESLSSPQQQKHQKMRLLMTAAEEFERNSSGIRSIGTYRYPNRILSFRLRDA